jgi:hypothetical protein
VADQTAHGSWQESCGMCVFRDNFNGTCFRGSGVTNIERRQSWNNW